MCIRDREVGHEEDRSHHQAVQARRSARSAVGNRHYRPDGCLLYTSDAADERSSVDLGGRRIIKKKTNEEEQMNTEY